MESTCDFRGDLEDIVRAGSCGVVSDRRRYVKESEEDSSNNMIMNPANLSKLSLSDEEYFNFYCKQRDYFANSTTDDVFGDPFSNTRDPMIYSSTLDEQLLHLHEICNNTNGFINPLPPYNSCSRSSISSGGGEGLILETLTENSSNDNNINSKKVVIHGSEHVQQQQQVDGSNNNNNKMECMMINNHQRDAFSSSRLLQITNDFNHSAAAGVTTTATDAAPACSFAYDYSLSSTAMVNNNNINNNNNSGRYSSSTFQSKTSATKPILNMNPKDGPVGCMAMSNRIPEISSSPRNPILKRRKSQAKKVVCIPAPGGANSRQGGGEVVPSDLWAWRKYGQKPIKGSPYPRGYYRCSSSKGCSARKQVERSRTDPTMLVITYTSEHNHPWPTQRNALAGSTRTTLSTTAGTSPPPCITKSITMTRNLSAELEEHDTRQSDCISTAAVTAVEQCILELEDDDHNNSSSYGLSSSGDQEPILFGGDDDDHARNSQLNIAHHMPFSSLLLSQGGFSAPAGGMISITNHDQKQLLFSSDGTTTTSTSLFGWPSSNQPH